MIWAYSFRLKREAWLLEEEEWLRIDASGHVAAVQAYRKETGADLKEAVAKATLESPGARQYTELTGTPLQHADEIYAMQASRYGRLCPSCVKPFRTPKAKFCAECGYSLPDGETAGPLTFWKKN